MKKENFMTSVFKYPNQITALYEYINTFPNGQMLDKGKSRTQRYEFSKYVVFIYETKTFFNIKARP